MKSAYKIIIASLVVVIIALVIYLIWFRGGTSSPSVDQILSSDFPVGTLPTSDINEDMGANISTTTISDANTSSTEEKSVLIQLSDIPIFDYWANEGAQEAYYLTADGKVFSAKEGKDIEISSQPFSALNSLEPNIKGDRALLVFGSPRSPQWGIFDAVDKAWRPLPSGIITATWGAKDNEVIAIISASNGGTSLGTYDASKTPPSFKALVQDFRFHDIKLTFISPTSLYIAEKPYPSIQNRLWLLNIKTLAFNTIRKGESELSIHWSQDKTKTFVANSSQFQIYASSTFADIFPVPFKTLAQKCEGRSSIITCFVPQNTDFISADSSLLDSFLTNKKFFDDALYVMNTASESMRQINVSELNNSQPIDAKNPRIAGPYLYFVNKFDNFLYRLTAVQE